MSKFILEIGKSVKFFGVLGVMLALFGVAAAAPSASAASLSGSGQGLGLDQGTAQGKLALTVTDAAKGSVITSATVVVLDANGKQVVKGQTNENGYFATYLNVGTYKVRVFSDHYKNFSQPATITANERADLKVGLQPAAIDPAPVPVNDVPVNDL